MCPLQRLCRRWVRMTLILPGRCVGLPPVCRALQVLSGAEWVEGLVIRYRASAGQFRSLSIHNSGGGSYIVSGLRKFARYQVFVVPFIQSVYGRPSNSRTVRTLQDGGWAAVRTLQDGGWAAVRTLQDGG